MPMPEGASLFFDLIQVATGQLDSLPVAPDETGWERLLGEARRQALQGVLFAAIERLPHEQRPPRGVLLTWYGEARRIEADNARLDRAAVEISQRLQQAGLRSVVLKGQGVARLYPRPELRVCGDIDIWIEGQRWSVLRRLGHMGRIDGITYHHADWHCLQGVEVEAHNRPTWMYSPRLNYCLQRWFAEQSPRQFSSVPLALGEVGKITVPSTVFNLVYLLVHLFRHTLFEGVGLRQLMDYYYALSQPIAASERAEAVTMIRRLGLLSFAGAVMHIEQRVFGLSRERMITPPRTTEGERLLADVMHGGNFGHYSEAPAGRFTRIQRVARFTRRYPEEALWALPFKLWHLGWRAVATFRIRQMH